MTTTIRCSSLPAYPDCPRRTAARLFGAEITEAGFALRQLPPTVGAATGTAVHHAAAVMLRAKRDGHTVAPDEAIEQAIAGFREETAQGAVWDDTTPERSTAETQIAREARMYAARVLPTADPLIVENTWPGETEPRRLRADLGDGFELSGHIDLGTRQHDLDDLKTGALWRPYQAQHGGYSLLLRSQPDGFDSRQLRMTWIPRTPKSKPQAEPRVEVYDKTTCEQAAWHTAQQMKRDLTAFRDGGSADPWVFAANPNSMVCGSKYCPAHGTDWCALGRKES